MAEGMQVLSKKTEKENMCQNNWLHRLLLLLITVILWQTWILLISGSLWNNSVLVYVMGMLIFNTVQKTEFHVKGGAKAIWAATVFSVICAFLFYAGVEWGEISGSVIISHLMFKMLFVLGGSFLTFWVWLNMKRLPGKRWLACLALIAVFTAIAFHVQGIINIRSLAGWTMTIWVVPVIAECEDSNKRITGLPFRNIREKVGINLLAAVFSCCSVLGEWNTIGQRVGTSTVSLRFVVVLFFLILVWFFFFLMGIFVLLRILDTFSVKPGRKNTKTGNTSFVLLCWGSIILFWMPYLLVWFPGMLSHDSITQMEQVMGELAYSNHHPWIHTLLIQFCVKAGMSVGKDIGIGVAFYSMFSMLFLALSCSVAIGKVRKKNAPKWMVLFLWCFFALCPIQGAYAVTMWKDIIFAGIVLLFLLILDSITEKYPNAKAATWLLFLLSGAGVCLFRSNGLYAWLFFLPFLIGFMKRKSKTLKISWGVVLGVLLLVTGYKTVLLPVFEVSEPDLIESLSIPAQQIACVLANDGNVTEEERVLLGEIIDLEKVKTEYADYISDPIKNLVRQKGNQDYLLENIGTYAKCWLNIGIRNLYYYIEAFVDQTKGYWYHKVDNWIFYFEGVHENTLGIERLPVLSSYMCNAMEQLMRITEEVFHKYYSIALNSWLLILGMVYGWIKKRNWLLYILPLGIVLSLLVATPVCAEFRYVYSNFLAVPVILCLTLCENKKSGCNV